MIYYVTPWCRTPSYLLGLYLGIIYVEYKSFKRRLNSKRQVFNFLIYNKKKLQRPVVYLALYACSFAIMVVILVVQAETSSFVGQSLLSAWEKFLQCIALCLFLLPSILGSRDLIVRALSTRQAGRLAKYAQSVLMVTPVLTQVIFSSCR